MKGVGYGAKIADCKPARCRPWTLKEAPLHFKLMYGDQEAIAMLVAGQFGLAYVIGIPGEDSFQVTLTVMAQCGKNFDGSPCGIYEIID